MRFSFPTKYSAITIGQLMGWMSGKTIEQKIAGVIGLPVTEVKKFPYLDVKKLHDEFESLLGEEFAVDVRHLKIDVAGKKVMVAREPDLYKMSLYSFNDATTFCGENYYQSLNKIMAVFYRPIKYKIGKNYLLEKYDSDNRVLYDEAFKDVPIIYFNGLMGFFLNLREQLAISSLSYFQSQLTKSLTEMTEAIKETT